MATPHLTSNLPDGKTLASERKLNACSGHLLVMRRLSAWTNKELLCTPSEESFSSAVVYAKATSYQTAYSSTVLSETNELAAQYAALWNGKTTNAAWTSGHKPLVAYYSRGWGPYLVASRSDLSGTASHANYGQKFYEFGGTRQTLKFATHALPAGSMTSFRAFLRFHNPSFVLCLAADGSGMGTQTVHCPDFAYNSTGTVRYRFDTEKVPPSQYAAEGCGEAVVPAFANEGKGSSGTSNPNGSPQFGQLYDVWNANGSAFFSYLRTFVYLSGKTSSGGVAVKTPYHYDHEITGDALARLKSCMRNGGVYLTVGAVPGNGITNVSNKGVPALSTVMLYVSRIELVFTCSGGKLNV